MKILEASNSNIKRVAGTVSPKSVLADAHIQKIIDYVSKETGKPVSEIENELTKKVKEFDSIAKKSPILYSSIAENIFEQELYKIFDESKIKPPQGCTQFNMPDFLKLVRRIKVENSSFFPLRNFFNKKPIAGYGKIIVVPSKHEEENEKWKSVGTAAATPKGEFIFNEPFMQNLMNFAYIQKIKPKGKKYASNGGEFADEWAPVEFLIMHEFYHYTHGDFHYSKVLGGSNLIHNWTGDFRSNYDLVKAGFTPPPIGLFNDHINYDRQNTYQEMYEIVKKEFEKLNKDEQKRAGDQLGESGDDHSQHGGDDEPSEGDSQPSAEDLEKAGKKASDKLGDKDEDAKSEKEQEAEAAGKGLKDGRGGRGSDSGGQTRAVDYSQIRPKFNWKQLLERLVKSSDTTEVTYQKVHRRNITGVHLAAQLGAGAIKPGEKVVPANLVKLCLVIDSSGSMSSAITTVLANIKKLLTENQSSIAKSFALVEFSSSFKIYDCKIESGGKGSARLIKGVQDIKEGSGGGSESLESIMTRHEGGATNFSDALAGKLKEFIMAKYNVVVLTDSDIIATGNKETFMNLYAENHQQVYLIVDSHDTFTGVAQAMKGVSANISHL